jgi:geranylgeranyl diphosphate synthase type I
MPPDHPTMVEKIEQQLANCVQAVDGSKYQELSDIFKYQLGLQQKDKNKPGKRIRPQLLLLTVDALGGNWEKALPAAAALELVHNYSLIHDDIEDKSKLRRGKDTVWVKYGEAQGINSGDAMLNLALNTPWQLEKDFPQNIVTDVIKTLQGHSFELTEGQSMDIAFESQDTVSVDDYFLMVEGKTCSLIKAAFELGAILGSADQTDRMKLQHCGSLLGRAYQIQDDWLGIWGDEAVTGKSNQSDLTEKKKTYPVLLGLQNNRGFASAWHAYPKISIYEIRELVNLLENEGIKSTCEVEFNRVYDETFKKLHEIKGNPEKLDALIKFAGSLLKRQF